MKKLSVIIPVYNASTTLHKCIDSVLGQDYHNIEIVLVDDGSKDDSPSICDEYAKIDSRIVVCHKENHGLVAARKTGVELASGDYIGFVDSDDYIDKDMYSSLMRPMYDEDVDVVIGGIKLDYHDHSVVSFNSIKPGVYDKKAIADTIIPKMLTNDGFFKYGIIPGVVIKVFKKTIIQAALNNVGDELTLGEDVAITSHALMIATGVAIIDSAAYHYIQTESSMIRGYNPKRFDAICKVYNCIKGIDNSDYQKQIGSYFACVLFGALSECANNSNFSSKEAKSVIRCLLSDKTTCVALESADVSAWKKTDRLKVYMMKRKCVALLTLILKRR